MANYRDDLTAYQIKYLEDNLEAWYNDSTTVMFEGNNNLDFITMVPDNDAVILTQVRPNSTIGSSVQATDYWIGVYDGTNPNVRYVYINHNNKFVDSVETVNIPSFPSVRYVVDTQDLIAIKDSQWKWFNLYKVLTGLTPDVEAIPSGATARQDIAYNWDSEMSWRIFSPYMTSWVKGKLSELQIANFLKAQFLDKWNKLYDALTAEYNPLHNYDMHEIEHTDDVKDEDTTTSGTGSRTGSVTTEDDTTTSNTTTETLNTSVVIADDSTDTHDVYAFNSESYSHAAKDTNEADRTTTTTGTNTNADSGSSSTDTSTTSTESTTSSGTVGYTTDNDKDRELTRSGNIGVTTSQQLLEAELKLRQNIVLDTIKDDIIATLTIPYYGGKY